MNMNTAKRIAVVTGGNKGIGFSICKQLAKSGPNIQVILTARNQELGNQALDKLHALGAKNIEFQLLDLDKEETIANFSSYIKSTYQGLDILVNNAGKEKTLLLP